MLPTQGQLPMNQTKLEEDKGKGGLGWLKGPLLAAQCLPQPPLVRPKSFLRAPLSRPAPSPATVSSLPWRTTQAGPW